MRVCQSSANTYTLSANLENLGVIGFEGTGNSLNNDIDGSGWNNLLNGGAGNDTIGGDYGDDTLNGDDGNDHLYGSFGNDLLNGGNGNDYFNGSVGNYTLNGGAGQDEFSDWIDANTYVFQFGDSSFSAPDEIENFKKGERISLPFLPNSLTRAADPAGIYILTLDALKQIFIDADGALAGNQPLGVNSAAIVNIGSLYGYGSLIINDSNPGFQENQDLVISLNMIGTLPALGVVPVEQFFTSPTQVQPFVSLAVSPSSVTEDGTANLVYTLTRTGSLTNPLTVNYGISENSTTNFTYTFTRTGNLTNPLTVNFNVAGDATLGTDYVQTGATSFSSTTGKVTFAANSATAKVVINPTGETLYEYDETVALQLTSGTGYAIGTTSAVTATIIDDDDNIYFLQVGTDGKDLIVGTSESDFLVGGLGNDTITGGANFDMFAFTNSNQGIDRITDFTPNVDYIGVYTSGFDGGLTADDFLKSDQLTIGTGATNATQRFIYNSGTGALWFDQDGTGTAAAIQLATLNTGLALTNYDIYVY